MLGMSGYCFSKTDNRTAGVRMRLLGPEKFRCRTNVAATITVRAHSLVSAKAFPDKLDHDRISGQAKCLPGDLVQRLIQIVKLILSSKQCLHAVQTLPSKTVLQAASFIVGSKVWTPNVCAEMSENRNEFADHPHL